jgi:hypothetical protein
MSVINLQFIAYIPKSLGKSLLSYFKFDPKFNPKVMTNYDEFKRKLEGIDRRNYKWLPEPGNLISHYYFATDEADFHNSHNDHSVRLSVNMNIDIAKIGSFTRFDESDIFRHSCGNSNQHSDDSHRVEAYIRPTRAYYDYAQAGNYPTDIQYEGICGDRKSQTAVERPLKKSIRNTFSGKYFIQPGTRLREDSTIIEASASAEYPFLEYVAPKIDFKIAAKLYLNGNTVEITVDGEHNDFPAYELLIDNKVVYNYDPSKYGYTGPTPYNLGMASTHFHASKTIGLTYWQVKAIQDSKMMNLFAR